MKSALAQLLAFCLFVPLTVRAGIDPSALPDGFTTLEIGDSAPAFSLSGVDGKNYALENFGDSELLMVLFTGTHCPTSHAIEGRLRDLLSEVPQGRLGIVAINPSHPDGLREDEYGFSNYDETFEGSKRYAEDQGWAFPFLYDGVEQVTAKAYGCLATPHVFLFDADRKLRYSGRFDDSRFPEPATVKHPDARNAVEALLAGEPVPVERTRPHGCSTKWKGRVAHVSEVMAFRQNIKATIEPIDAEGVAALRKNGSGKYRLINLWATWCAPCKEEFPDLVAIGRKFGMRNFELITISLDQPKREARALKFLDDQRAILWGPVLKSVQAEGRSTNNYLYSGSNTDALAAALDPEWPGPVPYSLLIDPEGKILYRASGRFDADVMKQKILEAMTSTYSIENDR